MKQGVCTVGNDNKFYVGGIGMNGPPNYPGYGSKGGMNEGNMSIVERLREQISKPGVAAPEVTNKLHAEAAEEIRVLQDQLFVTHAIIAAALDEHDQREGRFADNYMVRRLCLRSPVCPKRATVAQKLVSVLVFVIWAFYGTVSAVAHPFAAETHEPLRAAFVSVSDLAHHIDRPIVPLKSSQCPSPVLGRYPIAPHFDLVLQRNCAGLSNLQFLARDQQFMESSLIWGLASGQTSLGEIDSVATLNNRSLGASRIYNYETSFDFISMVPGNESENIASGLVEGHMSDTQFWPVSYQELQTTNSVLLALNVCLLPAYQHLTTSNVAYSLREASGLFTGEPQSSSKEGDGNSRGGGYDFGNLVRVMAKESADRPEGRPNERDKEAGALFVGIILVTVIFCAYITRGVE
jgi:hypothetical protein